METTLARVRLNSTNGKQAQTRLRKSTRKVENEEVFFFDSSREPLKSNEAFLGMEPLTP